MKRLPLLFLLVLAMSASLPNQKLVLKTTLKQHWKTKIGCTSYRTIPLLLDGKIVIGSNGSYFRDYAMDSGNGVYILNSKNGKVINNFENQQFGDMDVNGVLNLNGLIYFGNDNEEFLCIDQKGNTKWRIAASGDIEHRPILLQNNGKPMIVFATETGQIQALDPKTGKEIWNFYDKKFSGWKMGENRSLFKIKMYFSEDCIFFNEPSLADLNGDGVSDLIYNSKVGDFTAINGKTGKLLWEINQADNDNYFTNMGREKPMIIGKGEKSQIMVLLQEKNTDKEFIALYNAKGKLIKRITSSISLGTPFLSQTSGVFMTDKVIIIPSDVPNEMKVIPIEFPAFENEKGINVVKYYYQGQVAANKVIFNDEPCAVVVLQSNVASEMMLVGLNSGKVCYHTNLPGSSEFPPYVEDVTNDGKLDFIFGCYDENLYCFDLDIDNSHLITK